MKITVMELVLKRNAAKTKKSTIGNLYIDGKWYCYVLEDVDRGLKKSMSLEEIKKIKVFGQTAIPTGKYQVVITYSEHFKKYLPLLMNVPGFEGVRIHSGNVPADTKACLLVGLHRAEDTVTNSADALLPLLKLLLAAERNEKIYITIE